MVRGIEREIFEAAIANVRRAGSSSKAHALVSIIKNDATDPPYELAIVTVVNSRDDTNISLIAWTS
jgi:hypothetical protein